MAEFDLGRVLHRSWQEFSRGISAYLLIVLISLGTVILLGIIGVVALLPFGLAGLIAGSSAGAGLLSASALAVGVGLLIAFMAISLLLGLMQLEVTSQLFGGYQPSLLIAYEWSLRKFWRMAALVVVMGVGIVVGYIFLILPGIFLTIIWALAPYILIKEDLGPFDALQRSTALTVRAFGWVSLAILVLAAVGAVIGLINIFPLIGPLIGFVFTLVLSLFTQPYYGALYEELRRVEASVSVPAPSAASPTPATSEPGDSVVPDRKGGQSKPVGRLRHTRHKEDPVQSGHQPARE